MALCKICYHYKYTVDYVESLDSKTFKMLLNCIDRFTSQEMIRNFTVQDYPHMGKQRSKVHKEVFKVAYPEQMKKRIVTADDLLKKGFKGIK